MGNSQPSPPRTVLFGSRMATGAGFHQTNQCEFVRFAKAGNYLGTLVSRAWATDPLIGIHGRREADLPKWGAKGSTVRERRPCGARGARTGPTLRDRFRPHWIGVYGERPRASHVCHLSGHGDLPNPTHRNPARGEVIQDRPWRRPRGSLEGGHLEDRPFLKPQDWDLRALRGNRYRRDANPKNLPRKSGYSTERAGSPTTLHEGQLAEGGSIAFRASLAVPTAEPGVSYSENWRSARYPSPPTACAISESA